MSRRPALMIPLLVFALAAFLVAPGCDLNRRSPRAPDEGATMSEDAGEWRSADGGSRAPAPGPTFTAQPGDIQI